MSEQLMGYWDAQINKARALVYVDEDFFIHFRDTNGCIYWNDFDEVLLLERLNENEYWTIKS